MIRLLIFDELHLRASMLASVLEDEVDIEIGGSATTIDQARQQVGSCDIAVVNTDLTVHNPIEVTKILVKTSPDIKILVIGVPESEHIILKYIEAGATGYVLRDETVEELLKNIRLVAEGAAAISPEIVALLATRVTDLVTLCEDNDLEPGETVDLTPREREVLELIGQGLDNQSIARQLVIEYGTVKNHVNKIFKKLNVNSRRDAAAYLTVLKHHGVHS